MLDPKINVGPYDLYFKVQCLPIVSMVEYNNDALWL